ncbi:uncharacterized protein LOC114522483 isoform X2 [Dendronephthya gigantea]|uniref:uncharacterized protein LOC114522483 isoform X2 n=1 Tax=Dendronephthya gigantea TaxID=151771 RepID=UPI001069D88B|nr:uncharacterized protein LOC114522483 isoform X2 [Dendronephthya gigantea]
MACALETHPINELEENLQCTVCLEPLKDPRTLPCFHSFCKDCLEDVVKTCRDKAPRGRPVRDIPCPYCREMFTLDPDKNVADMRRNHFICNMVKATAVLNRERKFGVPCSHNCSQSYSVARCVTCEKFLCQECLTTHNSYRGHAGHSVLTMEELSKPENRKKIKDKMYCNEHPGEILKVYCETCDQLICKDCMDFRHIKQNHSCFLVKDVVSNYTKLLTSNNEAMDRVLNEGNVIVEQLANTAEELDRDAKLTKAKIVKRKESVISKVVKMLNKHTETLLNEVDQLHKEKREVLDGQTRETKQYVDNVQRSAQLSKKLVEEGTEEEIISSQKIMLKSADNLLKKRQEYFEPVTREKLKYTLSIKDEPSNEEISGMLARCLGIKDEGVSKGIGKSLTIDRTGLTGKPLKRQAEENEAVESQIVSKIWSGLFCETRVKLSDDFTYKIRKEKALKEIIKSEKVNIEDGRYLSGTWNAIFAVGHKISLCCSDKTENYASSNFSFTLSTLYNQSSVHPTTTPSNQTSQGQQADESLTLNTFFLRHIMAYHYEEFQNFEKVSKEICIKVKSKTERNLKLIMRDNVDQAKFLKTVNKFIDFYQAQNQKMHQEQFQMQPKDKKEVISQARSKFSVVIDSSQEEDKITIYGEKDKVKEALNFLKEKVGGFETLFEKGEQSSKRTTGTNSPDATLKESGFIEKLSCVILKNIKLTVYKGDITKEDSDVIVNPANGELKHDGGEAGAIVKAGGRSIQDECDKLIRERRSKSLNAGMVVATKAGNLPCNLIIHAVGPRWYDFRNNEKDVAKKVFLTTVLNCLTVACKNGATSISIPAISSGIFGVPVPVCAEVLFQAATDFARDAPNSNSLVDIRFVNPDRPTVQVFEKEMKKRFAASVRQGSIEMVHTDRVGTNANQYRQNQFNAGGGIFTGGHLSSTTVPGSHSSPTSVPWSHSSSTSVTGSHSSSTSVPWSHSSSTSVTGSHSSSTSVPWSHSSSTSVTGSHSSPTSVTGSHSSQTSFPWSHSASTTVPGSHSSSTSIPGSHSSSTSVPRSHSSSTPFSYSNAMKGNTTRGKDTKPGEDSKDSDKEKCQICLSDYTDKKTLPKCGHSFCASCIDKAFKYQKKCPICGEVYGALTGNQPPGQMFDSFQSATLPGFTNCGSIVISYRFPSGTQGPEHPHPGKPYQGTNRTAFLPDNEEGRKVRYLLRKAFNQKLTFTVGRSTTTGRDDCVIWNDIPHKTNMTGGATKYVKPSLLS